MEFILGIFLALVSSLVWDFSSSTYLTSMTNHIKREYKTTLVKLLQQSFNPVELNNFAYCLCGVDKLPKEEADNLFRCVERHQLFVEFITLCKRKRPDIQWPSPPWLIQDFQCKEKQQDQMLKIWEKILELSACP